MSNKKNKFRILVADDDLVNIKLLIATLKPYGYEVVTAANGEQALKVVSDGSIDLILLDVMMPGLSGFEVTEKLRTDKGTQHIPIVLLTALNDINDRIKGIDAGCDDFISKPFDQNELLARIRSLLRIKSLHDELEESYIKLKDLQKLKDDLAKMITHDINNILTGVKNNLELMSLESRNMPEVLKESLEDAIECTTDLVVLVSDFMDIGKMEEGALKAKIENTDINALIFHVIKETASVVRKAGINLIRVNEKDEIYFEIDKNLIVRVINNLIINSIKFTPQGGTIEVGVDITENVLEVFVKDTGSGIPFEYREKIFEKFSQIETTQANLKKGRGLGLTFCKLAVEAHGGKIWVESEGRDKGSTFIFTIPEIRNKKVKKGVTPV